MGDEEADTLQARREQRRLARRDRTRSPPHRNGAQQENETEEGGTLMDGSSRRKSLANFSASKLVENLKETNETTITRLRRTTSTDGGPRSPPRRPPGRTMSAQGVRRTDRRIRAADTDVLSQSMGDVDDDIDNSNMRDNSGRRRLPLRTKSSDGALQRGGARVPRGGRRRPPAADREEAADELSGEQSRRRTPMRSKSAQDAFPTRGPVRPARPGRRRPQANNSEEEDVLISDSDEEDQDDNNNNIDRSSQRRRGVPQRTRSAHGPQRTSRAARNRRQAGDRADPSPKRCSGPGFQRSLTGTPPSGSSSGPAFGRSLTSTNPRGARSRGGRNTAAELAQVASKNREFSPDPEGEIIDGVDRETAREAIQKVNSQHQSSSPIKSRQERRRLREGKEREVLERRMQGQSEQEVLVEPEKKEAPWMRRLKKNVGDRAPEDSSSLGDGTANTEGSKGSSLPSLGIHNTFAVDPTFGVFPAVSDMPLSTMEADAFAEDDGTTHLSATGGVNKLDFSTIS